MNVLSLFDGMSKRIKVIPIFNGQYEAAEDGNIYSLKRKNRRALIGKVGKSGYRMVVITINSKKQLLQKHLFQTLKIIGKSITKMGIN